MSDKLPAAGGGTAAVTAVLTLSTPRSDDPGRVRAGLQAGDSTLLAWTMRSLAAAGVGRCLLVAERRTPEINALIDAAMHEALPVVALADASAVTEHCAPNAPVLLIEEGLGCGPQLLAEFITAALRDDARAAVGVWTFGQNQADPAFRLSTTTSFAGLVMLPGGMLADVARDLGDWDLVQTAAQLVYREAGGQTLALERLMPAGMTVPWARMGDAAGAAGAFPQLVPDYQEADAPVDQLLFHALAARLAHVRPVQQVPVALLAALAVLLAAAGAFAFTRGQLLPGAAMLVLAAFGFHLALTAATVRLSAAWILDRIGQLRWFAWGAAALAMPQALVENQRLVAWILLAGIAICRLAIVFSSRTLAAVDAEPAQDGRLAALLVTVASSPLIWLGLVSGGYLLAAPLAVLAALAATCALVMLWLQRRLEQAITAR